MKFYLSSYCIGDEPEKLRAILPENHRAALISNARDYSSDQQKRDDRARRDTEELESVGLQVEDLDLRDYFGKVEALRTKMETFGLFWVSGGNTFVLRQAMKLSGFDEILTSMKDRDIVYGGYSAGVCVLSPSLEGLDIVDDPNQKPYGDVETVWKGLGLIDFAFAPHYQSNHPESADVEKEVAYYQAHGIPFRALRDGEAIVIE